MRASRVAQVAGKFADKVDAEGRFPHEAVNAMKSEKLLGIQVPTELGGEGILLSDLVEICCMLGQACANSAMIFAMHHLQLSILVEHTQFQDWHSIFMKRIIAEQLLLASATSEAGIGGNLRESICAIKTDGDNCYLEKDATVISYGAEADAILITSRASPSAQCSNQVITVFLKGQYTIEQTHHWDALGMRGTCSASFIFRGKASKSQILSQPFIDIFEQSMLPISHLLWSALWYGIAVDAVSRAQSFVRNAAKQNRDNNQHPGLLRVADASKMLQLLKSDIIACLNIYTQAKNSADQLSSMGFAIVMNNLKMNTSQTILQIINNSMLTCGMMAYKNGTPYSLGRHLRDAHSAQLMVSNERILGSTSSMMLVHNHNKKILA